MPSGEDPTPIDESSETIRLLLGIDSLVGATSSFEGAIDRLVEEVRKDREEAKAARDERSALVKIAVFSAGAAIVSVVALIIVILLSLSTLNKIKDATGPKAQKRSADAIAKIEDDFDKRNEQNIRDLYAALGLALGRPLPDIHFENTAPAPASPTTTTTAPTRVTTTAEPPSTTAPATTTTAAPAPATTSTTHCLPVDGISVCSTKI